MKSSEVGSRSWGRFSKSVNRSSVFVNLALRRRLVSPIDCFLHLVQ